MSTTEPEFDPEDYEGLQPKTVTLHPAELRKLRKEAKEAGELKQRVLDMERREMFARAGVPLDNPATDYLIRGYQGELTPEAIKAEAVKLNIIANPGATSEEIAAHQATQMAAAGGIPPGTNPGLEAQLREMAQKTFSATDEVGRGKHIEAIARLASDNNIRIPLS